MSYTDEQIVAYLSGELNEAEEKAFAETLDIDEQLGERVRIFREMDEFLTEGDWSLSDSTSDNGVAAQYKDFLSGEEGKSYTSVIDQAADQYFDESPNGKQVFWSFGRLAAAASVLLLAVAALFWMTDEPSGTALYAEYRDAAPLPSLTNRDSGSALEAYGNLVAAAQYQEALDWLEGYMADLTGPINPQLYLHKGTLQLNLDLDDDAIRTFEQLRDNQSIDADKAYWYLALTYLKKDQKAEAKQMLEQLVASGSRFNREAAEALLEALD